MASAIKVKLWNTVIGYLGYPENSDIATFEYDENFMKSTIYPSPLLMKYPPDTFTFENISKNTFKGVPGFIADSLPDKFGNQLIDIFMAEKGISQKNITALDRLLYVNNRGMGALEYEPAEFNDDAQETGVLDIGLLSTLAQMSLSKKEELENNLHTAASKQDALNMIRVGSSAGGARAKALVVLKGDKELYDGTSLYHEDNVSYWLLKFDATGNSDRDVEDPKGMTKIEYIYSNIARRLGINIPKTDFIQLGDDFHFLIERFDRVLTNNKTSKLHYISWAGMSHYDRDTTGAYAYEQLVLNIRELGLGEDAVKEVFKRAVFNIIGRNHDDHTKNFGFLMDKKGRWSLSPAFDMTYSYDPTGTWTKQHQIKLSGKQDDFTKEDIVKFGKYCNLSNMQINMILKNTIDAFKVFNQEAKKFNVDDELRETVLTHQNQAIDNIKKN
jgi:serine/threonine-protein kinase HipA